MIKQYAYNINNNNHLILLLSFKREIAILSHLSCNAKNVNILYYVTLCTFSFEINESRLSDTRCLIQDAVSPHCGDKRVARRSTKRSLSNYVIMTSYHWNAGGNTLRKKATA